MHDELLVKLPKSSLVNKAGLTYMEFKKTLTPRWGVIWFDIAMGWLALGMLNSVIFVLAGRHLMVDSLLFAGGAVLTGYIIAYLQLFFHEAAHYNLHSNRKINDLLCNVFISSLVGQDIRNYRPIHWAHHRYLGTSMDTEISYFDPLNIKFLVETMLGIRVFKVIFYRKKKLLGAKEKQKASSRPYMLLIGLGLNLAYLSLLLYFNQWVLIATWTIGILIFFPLFGALRQLLEHRSDYAEPDVDYTMVAHGTTYRLFGDGLIASTLGGAGFNRHMLHHWESQVSYTRLKEIEKYLMDTHYKEYLQQRQTTYWKTFRSMFRLNWR